MTTKDSGLVTITAHIKFGLVSCQGHLTHNHTSLLDLCMQLQMWTAETYFIGLLLFYNHCFMTKSASRNEISDGTSNDDNSCSRGECNSKTRSRNYLRGRGEEKTPNQGSKATRQTSAKPDSNHPTHKSYIIRNEAEKAVEY